MNNTLDFFLGVEFFCIDTVLRTRGVLRAPDTIKRTRLSSSIMMRRA
jgi:hypothetical protein